MKEIDIAKICHEANKAYCEGIGDNSQKNWNNAPDWQKKSAEDGVRFNLENPDAPASAVHDSWLDSKRKDGWVYGKYKDAQKKTHPCILPYEELPDNQKRKDKLFKCIVNAFRDPS